MFLLLAYLPVACILTNSFPAHTSDNGVPEGYHAGQGWLRNLFVVVLMVVVV